MSPSSNEKPSSPSAGVGDGADGSGEGIVGPTTSNGSVENQPSDNGSDANVINSLGSALAGMNIAPKVAGNHSFGFETMSESNGPFSSMVSAATSQNGNELGWISDASKSAFSGGSHAAPGPPPGKESYDLFLSQSPSQTLGDDVFKLSSTNLPALGLSEEERQAAAGQSPFNFNGKPIAHSIPNGGHPNNAGFGEIRPAQDGRRRTDSPSSAVTGTTSSSRSASPYANISADSDNRRGQIQAYRYDPNAAAPISGEVLNRRQQSYGEDDRSASGGYALNQDHRPNPQMSALDGNSRYGSDGSKNLFGSVGSGSPFEKDRNFLQQPPPPQQQPQQPPPPQQAPQLNAAAAGSPQQQVLYMAVPSPDGRGQVLQPVQMLQLSGKQFTYVVPGPGGLPGQAAVGADGSQGMRVLPPLKNQGVSPDLQLDARNKGYPHMDNGGRGFDNGGIGGRADDYGNLQKSGVVGGGKYMPGIGNQQDAASLYTTPQRPPLDALLGQVRRLSRDQVGCRLVQQALDEEGPLAATLILNEGLPFWSEAMVDPFGNYLFQKILEKITPEERIMLVNSVSSRLVNASLNLHGTRSVQKIVELCAMDEEKGVKADSQEESAAEILTRSLYPAAARLCIDSHGNHVIQRILLKLGPEHSKFVFDAVAASVGDVARHRHGCCVIQRCLDSPTKRSEVPSCPSHCREVPGANARCIRKLCSPICIRCLL